jgi:hypothetical protein
MVIHPTQARDLVRSGNCIDAQHLTSSFPGQARRRHHPRATASSRSLHFIAGILFQAPSPTVQLLACARLRHTSQTGLGSALRFVLGIAVSIRGRRVASARGPWTSVPQSLACRCCPQRIGRWTMTFRQMFVAFPYGDAALLSRLLAGALLTVVSVRFFQVNQLSCKAVRKEIGHLVASMLLRHPVGQQQTTSSVSRCRFCTYVFHGLMAASGRRAPLGPQTRCSPQTLDPLPIPAR